MLTCERYREGCTIPGRKVKTLVTQGRLTGERAKANAVDVLAPTRIEVGVDRIVTRRQGFICKAWKGIVDGEVVRRCSVPLCHGREGTGTRVGEGRRRVRTTGSIVPELKENIKVSELSTTRGLREIELRTRRASRASTPRAAFKYAEEEEG